MSWNCRGLGNPRTIRILRKITKEKCANLVFLVETKANKSRMETVRQVLKFDGCFVVESLGLCGGLAILWKEEWQVRVINYTRWHISAMVMDKTDCIPWQFTGFYGHPETGKRNGSWELLKMLKPESRIPWVCAGDFNEILHQNEKVGGQGRPYKQIEKFRQALEQCGIRDLTYSGQRYTWSNNRRGRGFTKERIDRAMANREWLELFPSALCHVMTAVKSDHSSLITSIIHNNGEGSRKQRVFRYEAAWDLREDSTIVLEQAWKRSEMGDDLAGSLRDKLETCQKSLTRWVKNHNQATTLEPGP
ncbi:uncharacterized protein LOC122312668 [Carya illinoinensis]|uniref:uncharacterized protein LOC122312668 n=1 Tax=Carya illinoinensis TaxID=32201 RepID=UPI001C721228|nr:uncharacterized protein LOC122312668 [Carya illinoinensis]